MKLVPVVFVHMCCPAPGVIAGQAANGDIHWRRVSWTDDRPWKYIPAALGPATKRRRFGSTTARSKPARRLLRR